MINIAHALKSERIMKALTGMTPSEFSGILPAFEKVLRQEILGKDRERAPGAGAEHTLKTPEEKLFYALFYVRCYPTCDMAAFFFGGVSPSQPCRWTHTFLPILEKALGRELVLPARKIGSPEEFFRLFPSVREVFADGTERPMRRSRDNTRQRADYSGKKKRHTRKNLVVNDAGKRILFLSPTEPGSVHDYTVLKNSGIASVLPSGTITNTDLGFQGIKKDFPHLNVAIPHKKPRGGELTPEQKAENRMISSHRVISEHAIGGIKRLKSLKDIYRNRKKNFDDILMNIGCGVWNYHLKAA